MLENILLLVLGLAFLIKGSDHFVKAAAKIAKMLGVSEFIIGLTLIALGTSLPELVSSIIASTKQQSGLIIGTISGADIANLGLIIGIASIITVLKTDKKMLERDGYMLLFAASLFFIASIDGTISRLEGTIFLLVFLAYNIFLFETRPNWRNKYHFRDFTKYFFKFEYLITIKDLVKSLKSNEKKKKKKFQFELFKDLSILFISGSVIVFGANQVVNQAIHFANHFMISATFIGILMSIGTTMPEFSVAVAAARKGYGNIIIGNSIGSCITNTLLILGISSMIFPLQVLKTTIFFSIPFYLFLSLAVIIFIKSNWDISRKEGMILISLYMIYLASMAFIFLN